MLTFDVGTKVREKLVIGYILITKNLNDEKKKKKEARIPGSICCGVQTFCRSNKLSQFAVHIKSKHFSFIGKYNPCTH